MYKLQFFYTYCVLTGVELVQWIAGMSYENNRKREKRLLDWERVNALKHRQKHETAQQETLDSRAVSIEERYVST